MPRRPPARRAAAALAHRRHRAVQAAHRGHQRSGRPPDAPARGDDTTTADRIGTLAGTHEDGGYALAQLLWLAERSADPGNATVAVIDLLDHHRATTPTTTIAATTREDCLR
ncbi:hypothetical protein [Nonomuraea wenchangensis]|uniref:hypothetical protein n=1 Tax=Nonomuraea wenchangensis TaxID=568860 RepID=UPI001FEC901D|nr:hypothetical protein [Nonomuraea wenchangensis]